MRELTVGDRVVYVDAVSAAGPGTVVEVTLLGPVIKWDDLGADDTPSVFNADTNKYLRYWEGTPE